MKEDHPREGGPEAITADGEAILPDTTDTRRSTTSRALVARRAPARRSRPAQSATFPRVTVDPETLTAQEFDFHTACGAAYCQDPNRPTRRICPACGAPEPMLMVSVSLPNGATTWMTLEEIARWPRV